MNRSIYSKALGVIVIASLGSVPTAAMADACCGNPVSAVGSVVGGTVTFVSDSAITASVKTNIAMCTCNSCDVCVTTENCVVYLSGRVCTEDQKQQVIKAAKGAIGAKHVDASKLMVRH